MKGSELKITGMAEIAKVLDKFPRKFGDKIVASAVSDALKPVLYIARENAPIGDESKGRVRLYKSRTTGFTKINRYGKLVLSLRKTIKRSKANQIVTGYITVGDAFWGMFQEFGTAKMPNPPHKGWLRRSFDAQYDTALRIFRHQCNAGVTKLVKRMAKKKR